MSYFRPLYDREKTRGWLVSHTREDGMLEIPLTDDPKKNDLLRHWATGRDHFVVDEYDAAGVLQPPRGDAWEPPEPIPTADWVRSV